jgi:TIR domain-containing protein
MPGIFVSHATRDRELVEAVVELLQLGSGVPTEQIFYSSGAGTGVPAGARFNSYIRSKVEESSLVIAIISPAFQESAFSIAEVGAAWVLEENFSR